MAEATHLAFGLVGGTSFSGSPVTSTHSIALTNGTNVAAKFSICAHKSTGGSPSVTGVTYNGVACTQIGAQTAFGTVPDDHFSEWWVPRPDTSAAHNLVITYDGTPSRVDIFWEEVEGAHATTLPVQEIVYTGSLSSPGGTVSASAPNTLGAAFATIVCFATKQLTWNANSPSDTTVSRQNRISTGTTIPGATLFTVASASTPYTAGMQLVFSGGTSAYVISIVRIPGISAANVTVTPAPAFGGGAAQSVSADLTVLPAAARGAGAAQGVSADLVVLPGAAQGAGAAQGVSADLVVLPGAAQGAGAAQSVSADLTARPGSAHGAGAVPLVHAARIPRSLTATMRVRSLSATMTVRRLEASATVRSLKATRRPS